MNTNEFNKILEDQIHRSTDMLVKKADEYASDKDRLHNFVVAGQLQGVSPREALGGMMVKHTVSIYDMIESGDVFPMTMWNEKITDHINYLLLLRAVVQVEDDEQAVGEGTESTYVQAVYPQSAEEIRATVERAQGRRAGLGTS